MIADPLVAGAVQVTSPMRAAVAVPISGAAGAAAVTVSTNVWLAVPVPLTVVNATWEVPAVVAVPEMVAVPLPLSAKVRPAGRPEAPMAGAGKPAVVTANDDAVPATKDAAGGLVKLGAWPTTIV